MNLKTKLRSKRTDKAATAVALTGVGVVGCLLILLVTVLGLAVGTGLVYLLCNILVPMVGFESIFGIPLPMTWTQCGAVVIIIWFIRMLLDGFFSITIKR